MPKSTDIQLPGLTIPILHEDNLLLAIDKPAGWLLAPERWTRTSRNLHAALMEGIELGDHWARSRNLKFLRFVHRLDAETSGVLLLAKSRGIVRPLGELFAQQLVEKTHLAVVAGNPKVDEWICELPLADDPRRRGRVVVNLRHGQPAVTRFRVLARAPDRAMIVCRPLTVCPHQECVHLAASGHPVLGDPYFRKPEDGKARLGLRAIRLAFQHPFTRRWLDVRAATQQFASQFGFTGVTVDFEPAGMARSAPRKSGRTYEDERSDGSRRSNPRAARGRGPRVQGGPGDPGGV